MSVTRNLGFAIILVWFVKLAGEFSFWVLERRSLVTSLEWISARLNALECSSENWKEIDGLMLLEKTLGLTILNAHRQLVYSAVLIILTAIAIAMKESRPARTRSLLLSIFIAVSAVVFVLACVLAPSCQCVRREQTHVLRMRTQQATQQGAVARERIAGEGTGAKSLGSVTNW